MVHEDDLRNLIRKHHRRLQLLKEQQAAFGPLHTPVHILTEIEDTAAEIDRLQTELAAIESDAATLPQRVEAQRQRIAAGLDELRQQAALAPAFEQRQIRVVGRPPLAMVDHFKDRVRECEKIGELLASPGARLVSVIGPGGMGKTALVSKVLRDLEKHRWPHPEDDIPLDGIVYLSTRTTGISLERLFLDCARLLGGEAEKRLNAVWTNPQLGTNDKISHLLEALREGRYVILLDNLEDLLDDQGQLVDEELQLFFDQSLTGDYGGRLLVTSRLTLAFKREVMRFDRQVKLLEGLPIPDGVALLRELDPNGDYGLRHASEEELAQAVSLVHGVPRALEVLAGILANDPFASLTEVVEQFYEQKDVVQALIEENYKRLDDNARRVIEALAVFKRPVPPLAVDYLLEPFVCGLDVPSTLRRLTHTNMVSIDRAAKAVTLHPIDQDYAYSQLPEEGEYSRQALERRAADYYVQLRTPEETWKTINDLEPQLVEFEHRTRVGDYDEACRILDLIDFDYLFLWGYYERLVEMHTQLLEKVRESALRVSNLGQLGRSYYILGEYERAHSLYDEAIQLARETGNKKAESIWVSNKGNVFHKQGDFKTAIQLHTEALSTAQQVDYHWSEELCIGRLGHIDLDQGRTEAAIARFNQAIKLAQEVGDQRYEGVWRGYLGTAYRALGKVDQGIKYHEQSLDIARNIGDQRWQGKQLGELGTASFETGQFQQAINYLQGALEIAHRIGDVQVEGSHLGQLGLAFHRLGKTEVAISKLEEALKIARQLPDPKNEAQHLDSLGSVYRSVGRINDAIDAYRQALAIAQEIKDKTDEGHLLGRLGVAFRELGKLDQAKKTFDKALKIARELKNQRQEARHLGDVGSVYRRLGKYNQAIEFHKKALDLTRVVKDSRDEGMWLNSLGLDHVARGAFVEAVQYFRIALDLSRKQKHHLRESFPLLGLGNIKLINGRLEQAHPFFIDAADRCQSTLTQTPDLYEPRYNLAAALLGQAICSPDWSDEDKRLELLVPVLTAYQRALDICAAPGVVQDAIRDLELIQTAGIEGLEPVFDLLQKHTGPPLASATTNNNLTTINRSMDTPTMM